MLSLSQQCNHEPSTSSAERLSRLFRAGSIDAPYPENIQPDLCLYA
jgi:hypothetical protein